MPYPDLSDPEAIRRFATQNPVEDLSDDAIVTEFHHWNSLLDQLEKNHKYEPPGAKAERRTLRWGGLGGSVLGIPAAFWAWPIGLTIAVAGLAVTSYGELRGWRERRKEREREMRARPAIKRRDALIDELLHRVTGR